MMDDAARLYANSPVAALAILVAAARRGGDIALGFFSSGAPTTAAVSYKAGDSPVTAADFAVDAALKTLLCAAFPQAGWLSEESEDDPARQTSAQVLVLDPIDGTRAFMRGDPCFAVALALVEGGRPVAGVVHAPALRETYAAALGAGATLNGAPIHAARLETLEGARVGGPQRLRQALATQAGFRAEPGPPSPSLAYRLVSVAAARLDIGLAGPGSHDWDIAAADVILQEAGAGLAEGGRQVRYNQASTRHDGLVAAPREWLARLSPGQGGA